LVSILGVGDIQVERIKGTYTIHSAGPKSGMTYKPGIIEKLYVPRHIIMWGVFEIGIGRRGLLEN